ncbi:hypothetical protein [Amycolatopsis magusensis]|uniref:hypothetical protein n=1 Tax=Amycolatopsis magusensis TaxID=882444 RepID=UPI0027B9A28B|nr:hypothetical protein [Amycolatopsis magusensis]
MTATTQDLDAARLLLSRLGVDPADLLDDSAEHVRSTARVRRNSRGGRNAAENFIAAMRCLYKHLVNDGRLDERANPAKRVTKPRRNPSTRRAIASDRISEPNDVVASTGDDPELDTLICRPHKENACRRGGALALRRRDLDRTQCMILLREKGEPNAGNQFRHTDATPRRAFR